MAILFKDRVKDTGTTTGTGDFTVSNSAPAGFQTFNAAYSTGSSNKFYYAISLDGGSEWEVGISYMSSSTVLVRGGSQTVLASSNSGSAVSFSAGAKTVFSTVAAKNFIPIDGSASPSDGNALIYSSSTGLYAPGTVASGPTILTSYLTSDTTVNNSTSLVTTGLSVTVASSGAYYINIFMPWTLSATAGAAPKFDLNGGTATATTLIGMFNTSGAYSSNIASMSTSYDSFAGVAVDKSTWFDGTIIVNAGGTFIPRFAQHAANGVDTKILTGARMILIKLN